MALPDDWKIVIIDENTGRPQPGRTGGFDWNTDPHQLQKPPCQTCETTRERRAWLTREGPVDMRESTNSCRN